MRKIHLLISLFLILVLTACTSGEGKEVLEYHNVFVKEVVGKTEKIDDAFDEMENIESEEEMIEFWQKEILPIADEIEVYMNSQTPKKEDAKEYHQLRLKQLNHYSEMIKFEFEIAKDYINEKISEEELYQQLETLEEYMEELKKLTNAADDKIEELSDKHKFEESSE